MDTTGWSMLCGCAPFTNFVFCAQEPDDAAEEGRAVTGFYLWDEDDPDPDDKWMVYDTVVSWRAQGMATVKPEFGRRLTIAIGTRGQYFEVEPESMDEAEGTLVGRPGPLRRLVSIAESFIAVGMGRTVLQRESRGRWNEIGPGTLAEDENKVIGFEGVDGYSLEDLYTAGWAGEIWHRAGESWERIDSPTNANLNAVACAPDGSVYIVGDDGSMVVGDGREWRFVDTGRAENLQDVAEFDGELFVVTDFQILRLTEEGLIAEDRFANGDAPTTCLHLLRAADGIISLGPKDLFRFSGGFWERIL
jgi:hypothetical protein